MEILEGMPFIEASCTARACVSVGGPPDTTTIGANTEQGGNSSYMDLFNEILDNILHDVDVVLAVEDQLHFFNPKIGVTYELSKYKSD